MHAHPPPTKPNCTQNLWPHSFQIMKPKPYIYQKKIFPFNYTFEKKIHFKKFYCTINSSGSLSSIIKENISPEITVNKEGSQLAYYLTQIQKVSSNVSCSKRKTIHVFVSVELRVFILYKSRQILFLPIIFKIIENNPEKKYYSFTYFFLHIILYIF